MENYSKTSHSVYDLKYHLVWITKYRKAVLYGQIANRTRDLIRERGSHIWGRGYFAASSGNVTDEVIMQYIEQQDISGNANDDFDISP